MLVQGLVDVLLSNMRVEFSSLYFYLPLPSWCLPLNFLE